MEGGDIVYSLKYAEETKKLPINVMRGHMPHPKHSMVVYYTDDKHFITIKGFEGIKNLDQLFQRFGKKVVSEYMEGYPRACIFKKSDQQDELAIITSPDEKILFVRCCSRWNKTAFFTMISLLEQCGERLRAIRMKHRASYDSATVIPKQGLQVDYETKSNVSDDLIQFSVDCYGKKGVINLSWDTNAEEVVNVFRRLMLWMTFHEDTVSEYLGKVK